MNVTLELKNIVKHSYEDYKNDINSIRNGYTVTDKADGERNLLVILSDGRLFMVNRKNDIKFKKMLWHLIKLFLIKMDLENYILTSMI